MDASGRALRISLLLLLFPAATGWAQLTQTPHQLPSRDGVWFSAGLGAAGGEGGFGGTSANLALGWTVSPKVLLGLGSTAVRGPADRTNVTFGTLDFRALYYPQPSSGLFVLGGLGMGFFRMDDSGSGPDLGGGLVIGLGYDIHLAQDFSLTPWANWFHFHTSDPRGSALAIGAGITVH